jgi:hypothetical protein
MEPKLMAEFKGKIIPSNQGVLRKTTNLPRAQKPEGLNTFINELTVASIELKLRTGI